MRRLVSRTEGWIAGLHLAALALQKRQDRAAFLQAFTGSQRYLLDYVQEDILARLPESVRDFLLHTAILSRLDASVCQAVTAEPTRRASQQMLAFLERANLFLVPLDEERRMVSPARTLSRSAVWQCCTPPTRSWCQSCTAGPPAFMRPREQWAEAIAHRLAGQRLLHGGAV